MRYYSSLPGDEISVIIPYTEEREVWLMLRWCKQEFPKRLPKNEYPWDAVQNLSEVKFNFQNANDAMRFKLVWG